MKKMKLKGVIKGFKKNGVNYPNALVAKFVLRKTKGKSKQSK